MNFHFIEEVVPTCLKQHGEGILAGHMRKIMEPLNVFSYGFFSFLDRQEELVDGHLSIVLVESRKKPGFQVNPRIDGAVGKAPGLIKGYLLKGVDQ